MKSVKVDMKPTENWVDKLNNQMYVGSTKFYRNKESLLRNGIKVLGFQFT
jgi:hypothetical protein